MTLVSELGTTGLAAPAPAPRLVLRGPAPNPLRAATAFTFMLPAAASIEVAIHDVNGRLITTLAREAAAAGAVELVWDGRDERGERVAAGIYLARLCAGGASELRKLVVLR